MYATLNFLGGSFKTNKVNIDNLVFKLHYKVTFALFSATSVLVITKQLFGENINCLVDNEKYKKVIDSFCWINSTFSMRSKLKGKLGLDFSYPGVAADWDDDRGDFKYHKYYQWVSLVLSVQALCFYFPRYLWKSFENGRISNLSGDLKKPMLDEKLIKTQKSQLINYLSVNMKNHNFYYLKFLTCEILNFINVFVQLIILDFFLDHQFSTYGTDVWRFYNSNNANGVDPSDRIFPKVTKCLFFKFGKSGTVERVDTICILSLNELNQKVFLIIWCWLIFLAFITIFNQFYRVLVCLLPKLRYILFRSKFQIVPVDQLNFVFNRCDVGDWWLIYQLTKNINVVTFKYIMKDLRNALKNFESKIEVENENKNE